MESGSHDDMTAVVAPHHCRSGMWSHQARERVVRLCNRFRAYYPDLWPSAHDASHTVFRTLSLQLVDYRYATVLQIACGACWEIHKTLLGWETG
ncbi:hypothetical protein RRG08_020118 [Elysia crispata]|uniref:Uncharacterized protein n=1 Tax=Elysia crispata TaxID=231223 RepID=A0AAE1A4G8_9GAST|nr:hypothetical protein RRG08_020118 [Elysia crispata]